MRKRGHSKVEISPEVKKPPRPAPIQINSPVKAAYNLRSASILGAEDSVQEDSITANEEELPESVQDVIEKELQK